MGALIVTAAGQILKLPGSRASGRADITEFFLYVTVQHADGAPVVGLTGQHFQARAYASPTNPIDIPTQLPKLDEDGEPVVDDQGNPELVSLVQPLAQPGLYQLGGAIRGLSVQAFWVQVQDGAKSGRAVGAAAPM
jgi:hypothetical protein